MNLFSGVVFYQFTRIKLKRQTNDALLTVKQKHWNLIVYSIVNTKFPPRVDPPDVRGFPLLVLNIARGQMHQNLHTLMLITIKHAYEDY
jgi:hypothetical protein